MLILLASLLWDPLFLLSEIAEITGGLPHLWNLHGFWGPKLQSHAFFKQVLTTEPSAQQPYHFLISLLRNESHNIQFILLTTQYTEYIKSCNHQTHFVVFLLHTHTHSHTHTLTPLVVSPKLSYLLNPIHSSTLSVLIDF